MIWTVVIACLALAAYVYLRAQRRSDRKSGADHTGLAIVELQRGNATQSLASLGGERGQLFTTIELA